MCKVWISISDSPDSVGFEHFALLFCLLSARGGKQSGKQMKLMKHKQGIARVAQLLA